MTQAPSGFVPTVTGHSHEGGTLVLETLDPHDETNLVQTDEGLVRAEELLTQEQKDALAYQRQT